MADTPIQRSSAAWICCDTSDEFFFSIFLQSFIWLEDLTRKRKRGAGDAGGRPSCPAAGEDAEEDRGPAAVKGGRSCWERIRIATHSAVSAQRVHES